MNEEKPEFELEPVEIHPEYYEKNLFGEKSATGERSDLKNDAQGLTLGRQPFNIFTLTDAIGARKKRDAWVLYQKALASGMSAEDVFFRAVIWQVKNMLIASKTKNAGETDMKPYPYSKAKGFLKNFKPGELEGLSEELVLGYHAVRKGKGETETLIEKIILRL
ncbi:MAG: hypothetical protein AAB641_02010 [Patescibacteria group bacterium]